MISDNVAVKIFKRDLLAELAAFTISDLCQEMANEGIVLRYTEEGGRELQKFQRRESVHTLIWDEKCIVTRTVQAQANAQAALDYIPQQIFTK